MSTTTAWKRRDYKRACDICGHTWMFSAMRSIGEGKWACPDDAKGLTATQISRHNARARALRVNPVKHPKPTNHIDIYQLEEAQIFNFVTSVSPWNTQADKDNNATKSVQAAAHAAVYLAELLEEDERPEQWMRTARAALATNLTYLLTQQYGAPTGTAASDTTGIYYGGITNGISLSTNVTALSGVAFAKSYQTTGTAAHLDAARRCAQFLRHQQCAWRSSGADRTLLKIEGVAAGVSGAGVITTDYYLADQGAAAWFLSIMSEIQGGSTSYGEASSSYFSSTTLATLEEMIQAVSDFVSTGVPDANEGGALTTGLSATTPRLRYRANTTLTSVLGFWTGGGSSGGSIVTDEWALCLFGLDAADLLGDQVTAAYDFLMGMTANPANAVTTQNESVLLASAQGTYSPLVAPAVSVETTGTETTGTYYSWSAAAWLGSIQSRVNPAAFKASKDILSVPRRVDTASIAVRYMGPLGRSGLSYQVANLEELVAVP